jgi:hypothetical protein
MARWHPDPWQRAQHRFFDGYNWTSQVANNGVAFIDHGGFLNGTPSVLPAPTLEAGIRQTSAPTPATPRTRRVWTTFAIVVVCAIGGLSIARARTVREGSNASPATTAAAAIGEPLAVCRDGTQARNNILSATCSAHGGVERWISAYGTCIDGIVVKMAARDTCGTHGGFGHLVQDTAAVRVEDKLAASVRFKLSNGDLRSVSMDEVHIVAIVKMEPGLTRDTTKNGGRSMVAETLEALVSNDLPAAVTVVTVVVLIDFVNKFGENHEGPVVTASYTRPTLARIVFANIDSTQILRLADAGLEIDPSFVKDDGS